MIHDIFIIDAKNDNPCIFYGQIEQSPQPPNLAEILSMFIQKSSALSPGKSDTTQTGQGKFLFSNFEKIYVILKVLPSGDMSFAEKFLKSVAERFIQKYGKDLETYGGDVSIFAGFSEIAAEIYSDLQELGKKKPEAPAAEVPAIPSVSKEPAAKPAGVKGEVICPECKRSNPAGSGFCLDCGADLGETVKVPAPVTPSKPAATPAAAAPAKASDYMRAPEPIKFTPQKLPTKETGSQAIKPMKREAYPDGIPEYSRDEILWNESQSVMNEYSAEFVEDSVSKLSVALSISLQHHYSFEIDFTNYPDRPTITIAQGLQTEIGEPLNDTLSFLKAWDPKIPPHIIEVVREFEALLTKLKTQGKLAATAEMPEAAMPELVPLKPLPKLTPEEEARIKKWEAQKKAEKLAAEKEATQKGPAATPAPSTAAPAGKGGVPCPACKHVNPPGSAFCMGCGKKFDVPAAKPPVVDKKELKRLEKEKKLQEQQKAKDDKEKEKADKQKAKDDKLKEKADKQKAKPEKAKETDKKEQGKPAEEEEEPEEEKEDE